MVRVSENQNTLQTSEGMIQQIDLINRAVTVRQEQSARTFDVPPACVVRLNGERVKLRMLQQRDRVSVHYRSAAGGLVARSIEARTRIGSAQT